MSMPNTYFYNTPIGTLEIIGDGDGIVSMTFQDEYTDTSEDLDSEVIKQCFLELEQYFAGERKFFDMKINPFGTDFQMKVWQRLMQIPYGETISYEALSIDLGDVKAIRAVAAANGKNRLPIVIPCHRVIGKDGGLTGFAGGLDRKEWLLKHEGALISNQLSLF